MKICLLIVKSKNRRIPSWEKIFKDNWLCKHQSITSSVEAQSIQDLWIPAFFSLFDYKINTERIFNIHSQAFKEESFENVVETGRGSITSAKESIDWLYESRRHKRIRNKVEFPWRLTKCITELTNVHLFFQQQRQWSIVSNALSLSLRFLPDTWRDIHFLSQILDGANVRSVIINPD